MPVPYPLRASPGGISVGYSLLGDTQLSASLKTAHGTISLLMSGDDARDFAEKILEALRIWDKTDWSAEGITEGGSE